MKSTFIKRSLFCVLLITLTCFNLALNLKSAIGIAAYDAFQKTLNSLSGIKVGTIAMAFNITCVLIQIAILRKKANISVLIQIPMNIMIGVLINLFYYDLLGVEPFSSYAVRLIVVIFAQLLNACFAAAMLMTGIITFSLEGACAQISRVTGIPIHRFRLFLDIFCMVSSIACAFLFKVPLTIREGTVISVLAFGPFFGVFMRYGRKWLVKLDLADPIL